MPLDVKTELYLRYRPTTLDEVVGQSDAVKVIHGFKDKIPHALLFCGPSGTGKTTLARIVASMLGVATDNQFDYQEVNCGRVDSPLDTIRRIDEDMTLKPMNGKARFCVLDEIQSFSRGKFAQEAMLKMLEDGKPWSYFALCTTDPRKVQSTVRGRCSTLNLASISNSDIEALVRRVARAEKAQVTDRVIEKIVEVAAGSARQALVNLEKVIGMADEKAQLRVVCVVGDNPVAFELAKALLPWKGSPNWKEVSSHLEKLKEEEPEGLRQMILATARTQLLRDGSVNAYKVIKCLRDPYYDRSSGHALLAADCFQAINGKG